ncbi:MAG: peptide ABC transporter substrate-binding protein [Firmicutes bacterium]|nr:peptide ABC transporter substrate-binding protein [Bacillota bacterium]
MKKELKSIFAVLLALAMVFSLAACGGGSSDGGSTEPTEPTEEPSVLEVCLASEPDTLDPALNSAVDGATMIIHLFSGLAKWDQDSAGKLEIVADCAEELVDPVENADGTVTYTYILKEGLKWSDGQDLTAGDFAYAWQRAGNVATGGDYYYMFENVQGYSEDDENAQLSVKAIDDRTLEVTLNNAVAYWNELLAFPTFFPVREDVVADEAWATDPSTYVSNGAYTMTGWEHNSVITLEKNENYHDADAVTMDKLEFYLSDDANNQLSNFKNGTWKMIDDVPTNEIKTLQAEYPDEFVIAGQIGTYYVCWNVNEEILPAGSTLTGVEAEQARAEIRQAIGLLYDRNYIVEEIGQAGQVPASSFVAMGMTDADGSEFYKNAGDNADFVGYYDVSVDATQSNFDKAVEILKKYYTYDEATGQFTDFPTLTYLYNTSEGHKAIGEYLASAMSNVGITMNLTNQEWATFLNTRKNGDYSIARNGWVADYNDPICFLDMWTTNSGNNDVQFGREGHGELAMYNLDLTDLGYDVKVENGKWSETYDVLISTIKSETDTEKRFALMHKAEDLLMSTGCICPIYYYTDLYMLSKDVDGFFSNPLGYKYFMYTTIK